MFVSGDVGFNIVDEVGSGLVTTYHLRFCGLVQSMALAGRGEERSIDTLLGFTLIAPFEFYLTSNVKLLFERGFTGPCSSVLYYYSPRKNDGGDESFRSP